MVTDFRENGWTVFAHDAATERWAKATLEIAKSITADPAQKAKWLQCGDTWFVGVDVLPNDPDGRIGQGPPLTGAAVDFTQSVYGNLPLHRGQLSVIYPDYPRPQIGETEAAFGYRKNRDAAHVDGLLAVGPTRARMLREPHAYVLGVPLSDTNSAASPLVVWRASHHIMRAAFERALAPHPVARWPDIDLTAPYKAARREVFAHCERVIVHADVGQAYVIHRHALHGVAPWKPDATAPKKGRMIAYFRPECAQGAGAWLGSAEQFMNT